VRGEVLASGGLAAYGWDMRLRPILMLSGARALVIVAALAASVSACKATPEGSSSASPALWEPIDEGFKGCEGG
jgi:hypothetical protein